MAFDFVAASSQNMEIASAVVSSMPLSIFARCETDTTAAGNAAVVSISGSSGTHAFQLRRNGGQAEAVAAEGGSVGAASVSGFGVGAISALTAVFASATSRTIYNQGGGSGTNATNVTPASLDRTNIGARYNTGSLGSFFDGRVCDVAIWDAALTAEEADILTRCSPLMVRPQNLVLYCPLIRDANDMVDSRAFTITGATAFDHLRVRRAAHSR